MRVFVLAMFGKRMRTPRTKSDPFTTTIGIDGTGLAAAGGWRTSLFW